MSELIVAAIYSIDSSSLMDWRDRYFPADIFVGLVAQMDALVSADRLTAPEIVKEVNRSGFSGELFT